MLFLIAPINSINNESKENNFRNKPLNSRGNLILIKLRKLFSLPKVVLYKAGIKLPCYSPEKANVFD